MKTLLAFFVAILAFCQTALAYFPTTIGAGNTIGFDYMLYVKIEDKETDKILFEETESLGQRPRRIEFGEDDAINIGGYQVIPSTDTEEEKVQVEISIEGEGDSRNIELLLYQIEHYETGNYEVTVGIPATYISVPALN